MRTKFFDHREMFSAIEWWSRGSVMETEAKMTVISSVRGHGPQVIMDILNAKNL